MKKLIFLAMVLVLLGLSSIAFSQNPKLSFRDIHLRMDVEKARILAKQYDGYDGDMQSVSIDVDGQVGEFRTMVGEIIVSPLKEDYKRFQEAVYKKYGKPTEHKITHWQNDFGAKWEGFSAHWGIGKDHVWLIYEPMLGQMKLLLILETSEFYLNQQPKKDLKF